MSINVDCYEPSHCPQCKASSYALDYINSTDDVGSYFCNHCRTVFEVCEHSGLTWIYNREIQRERHVD